MADTLLLIPAAGQSARMRGADKLLQPVHGEALLRRQAKMALACDLPVWVALPEGITRRQAVLDDLALQKIHCSDAPEGLGGTLRNVAGRLPSGLKRLLIVLPDLVALTVEDLRMILIGPKSSPNSTVWRGCDAMKTPGHPCLLARDHFRDLEKLKGDQGLGSVLAGAESSLIHLPNSHATHDLDTPEAWAHWRATHNTAHGK